MNAKGVQEQIGIQHNREGIPYQATEQALVFQKPQISFLIDQCH